MAASFSSGFLWRNCLWLLFLPDLQSALADASSRAVSMSACTLSPADRTNKWQLLILNCDSNLCDCFLHEGCPCLSFLLVLCKEQHGFCAAIDFEDSLAQNVLDAGAVEWEGVAAVQLARPHTANQEHIWQKYQMHLDRLCTALCHLKIKGAMCLANGSSIENDIFWSYKIILNKIFLLGKNLIFW